MKSFFNRTRVKSCDRNQATVSDSDQEVQVYLDIEVVYSEQIVLEPFVISLLNAHNLYSVTPTIFFDN